MTIFPLSITSWEEGRSLLWVREKVGLPVSCTHNPVPRISWPSDCVAELGSSQMLYLAHPCRCWDRAQSCHPPPPRPQGSQSPGVAVPVCRAGASQDTGGLVKTGHWKRSCCSLVGWGHIWCCSLFLWATEFSKACSPGLFSLMLGPQDSGHPWLGWGAWFSACWSITRVSPCGCFPITQIRCEWWSQSPCPVLRL